MKEKDIQNINDVEKKIKQAKEQVMSPDFRANDGGIDANRDGIADEKQNDMDHNGVPDYANPDLSLDEILTRAADKIRKNEEEKRKNEREAVRRGEDVADIGKRDGGEDEPCH